MPFAPTPPMREAAAKRLRSAADRIEPAAKRAVAPRPSPALLVRYAGRWWYRHELALVQRPEGRPADVQLHP